MEISNLSEKYSPILRQYSVPLIIGAAGLVFLGYGLVTLNTKKPDKPDILFEAASDQSPLVKNSVTPEQQQISVDIEGAVMQPGVYKLKADSRVQDALIAAGGMNNTADRTKVSQSLNLAARLTDGGKIYIPSVGEQAIASSSQNVLSAQASGGIVNINNAVISDLDSLPGVGQVTAQKIIDNRPYQIPDDLVNKKIVNKGVWEKIKDKVTVN